MNDNGSVYTCKNHTLLRWFNTKPGGRFCFSGELPSEAHPTGRPDFPAGTTPMKLLKARMSGVNPYDPSIVEEASIKTIDDVEKFVAYVRSMEEKMVFECECPGSDIVKVPD